jgi:hypothetical protein
MANPSLKKPMSPQEFFAKIYGEKQVDCDSSSSAADGPADASASTSSSSATAAAMAAAVAAVSYPWPSLLTPASLLSVGSPWHSHLWPTDETGSPFSVDKLQLPANLTALSKL